MPADVIPLLVCDDLVRRFGDVAAVDGVSFGIDHGETYGLIGPNGAGKTTTISMIAGLLAPDRGEARVAGIPIGPTATTAKARIGLVPQDLALYPDLSARENLRFFGRLQGLDRSELRRRVDEVLDLIGLADRADDLAKEYSGGMKRRLNIGIGLLHRPELLILDEPTVGVDPQSRNAILESIEALSVEGMGVLYTTHYMEEAERLCDRIGILDRGRMQAEGTRDELLRLTGEVDQVHLAGNRSRRRCGRVDPAPSRGGPGGGRGSIVDGHRPRCLDGARRSRVERGRSRDVVVRCRRDPTGSRIGVPAPDRTGTP